MKCHSKQPVASETRPARGRHYICSLHPVGELAEPRRGLGREQDVDTWGPKGLGLTSGCLLPGLCPHCPLWGPPGTQEVGAVAGVAVDGCRGSRKPGVFSLPCWVTFENYWQSFLKAIKMFTFIYRRINIYGQHPQPLEFLPDSAVSFGPGKLRFKSRPRQRLAGCPWVSYLTSLTSDSSYVKGK